MEQVPASSGVRSTPNASSIRSRVTNPGASRAPRRTLAMLVVTVFALSLGAAWTLLTRRELDSAFAADRVGRMDRVRIAYEHARQKTQSALQAEARMIVEEPRLKATLATENINAATIEDILADLSKLRGGGFFMVLKPDGRVFAQAGAQQLRGLDLSSSSIVKRAETETAGAVGSWVLDDKVTDLSITAFRYGDHLVAYLAVGQALDDGDARSLAEECGCEVATALGSKIVTASTASGDVRELLERMAAAPGVTHGAVRTAGATTYVTSAMDLGEVTQSHRLLVAAALGARPAFARVELLIWVPSALVLLSILFAFAATRSSRRPS